MLKHGRAKLGCVSKEVIFQYAVSLLPACSMIMGIDQILFLCWLGWCYLTNWKVDGGIGGRRYILQLVLVFLVVSFIQGTSLSDL